MSTYSTAGANYGEALGTYGDLEWGLAPAGPPVPTPTYATGSAARSSATGSRAVTAVTGPSGRSTVTGTPGTTLTTGSSRIKDRIG